MDLELEQPSSNPNTPDSKIDSQKIIQVGWVLFNQESGEIVRESQGFVNIGVPLSGYIKKLTGITDQQISDGTDLETVVKRMLADRVEYGADRVLYQWGNDQDTLMYELGIYRKQFGKFPWSFGAQGINVKHLYRIYAEANGLNPSGGLSKCIGRMGLVWRGQGKHNAIADARNTALLAHEIFRRMNRDRGASN